jgi:hypothetical protein
VTWVDSQIGLALAALEASGLANSTWVAFVGDHGWALGEHGNWAKQALFEHALRVPLILAPPQGAPLPEARFFPFAEGKIEPAAPQRLTRSNGIDTEPVFTPDGRSVFFVSDRGGGPQVYRVGIDGASPQRVTFSGAYNISPAVSPDGAHLAYITRQGNGYKLMLQDLKDGTVRPLSDTQDDESPSFAPNGRLIVYASRVQGTDVLMTTTLDGKIKKPIAKTTGGTDMREPAWGPYGR